MNSFHICDQCIGKGHTLGTEIQQEVTPDGTSLSVEVYVQKDCEICLTTGIINIPTKSLYSNN